MKSTIERSFTLIEMLVVTIVALTFIGLLATFALSSVERAQRTACVSNIRQIVIAMQLYAGEHNQMLPTQAVYSGTFEPDWSSQLTNYLGGNADIFKCPSDENARRTNFNGRAWRSYCVNGTNAWCEAWASPYKCPWPDAEGAPRRLYEIPQHVFLISENHGVDGATPPGTSGAVVGISEMESMNGQASAMHRDLGASPTASTDNENGGGNYGFADGRVEFHTREQYKNPNAAFDGGPRDPWKWL